MLEKTTHKQLEEKIKTLEKELFEIREREKNLNHTKQKYKSLFDNATVGLFRTRISDGKLIEINQRYAELAGYSSVEACMADFIVSESYVDPNTRKKLVLDLKEKGKIQNYEAQIRRKNGDTFWVSFSAKINIEQNYIEGVLIDITMHKQAEESLRMAYNIINRSPAVAFLWKNAEGWPVEYVSDNVTDLFGYTSNDFTSGKISYAMTVHPDDLTRVGHEVALYSGQRNRNEFFHEPYRIITKGGEVKYLDDRTHIRRDENGTITHYEGIVLDISERVKAEAEKDKLQSQLKQAHKMEAIGTLAGGISHDFNNILGIIMGNTELALDDVPEWNPARKNLEEVKVASLRAKDVIQQLLSFSRKTDHEMIPVDICLIIHDVLKLLRSSIPTHIDIRKSILIDSGVIMADPTQIHQLIINLCTNAAHAMTENGGVMEITVSGIKTSKNECDSNISFVHGQYVKLTVSDTGHGISKEHIEKIFDPYFTTKEVGEGSGIGLSVVHGIVQDHNGIILVDSECGRGTTFKVFFPTVEKKPVLKSKLSETVPKGNEKILFVDDEVAIANMNSQMLKRLGYTVTTMTSGTDTLETFRNQPDEFDLIISDMTMPEITGDKLAIELLKIKPDIPIILCTGYSDRINENILKSNIIQAIIMKPASKSELAETIRKVLDGNGGNAV